MPELVLGPVLRYVDATEATVWVETDAACEVEILGSTQRTFHVAGHHYAVVHVTGLEENAAHPYEVALDGERALARARAPSSPPSLIRTTGHQGRLKLCFGSCRVTLPHEPPYSNRKEDDERGREVDALYALARRMVNQDPHEWPDMLVLLGDQVYADEVSPKTLEFIRSRRDTSEPPGEEVKNFEEYTRLYWEAWGDPWIRWLFSNVRTADDLGRPRRPRRLEHLAGLARRVPAEPLVERAHRRRRDELLDLPAPGEPLARAPEGRRDLRARARGRRRRAAAARVRAATPTARPRARAGATAATTASVRLIVLDSRAGRVLDPGKRTMIDDEEWEWFVEHVKGDFDHLLIASSLPVLLPGGEHGLESWNEAVAKERGASSASRLGEKVGRGSTSSTGRHSGRSFEQACRRCSRRWRRGSTESRRRRS